MKYIKSKERVRKFGEVFTPEWVVKEMCDLLEDENSDAFTTLTRTFLDPTCGTGNFPVEILRRKLLICETQLDGIVAISTIYGVDIQEDNVEECRARLEKMYVERFGENRVIRYILERNFVCGDFLTKRMKDGTPIWFLEEYVEEEKREKGDGKKRSAGGAGGL